jgi:ATP-dependent helicase/nuclease subunit A
MNGQQQLFTFAPAARETHPPKRRNIVIEAGAGTGKTTAIVAEVLELLLKNEELSPERIVLMTFTEKAAGEIADRIHQALTEIELRLDVDDDASWPIGSASPLFVVDADQREACRRACAAQLARIETLRSQTIHSFCQMLLRQHPIEAGLDPQFKIIEGFERSLLIDELYDAWVDDETRINPSAERLRDWELLLAHVSYLFFVRDLVLKLVDRRDLIAEDDCAIGEFGDALPFIADAIATYRRAGDAESPIARYFRAQQPPASDDIDAWIDYLRPVAPEIRDAKLPMGKKHEAINVALKHLRAGDSRGDCVLDRLLSHRAAEALLAMTRRFVNFLDEEKRKRGVVDFDDLLLRTDALLRDDTVAERVRQQFDYVFVDEFQDTDRIQARIIDRLARDASGMIVAGKTVVVGDPKQSIYGFRRADPETYDAFTRALAARGADQRALTEQYRSDLPLLNSINAMFGALLPEGTRDPNVFRPAYRELNAAKTSGGDEARVTLLAIEARERADRHIAEAHAIAAWIEARRERGLKSFALLFRRLTKLDDYLDVFQERGIDVVLPATKLFLDRPAAVDLLAVLRAIAYPFDRGAEVSAARSPYFALTDFEIAIGCGAGSQPADAAWRGGATFREVRDSLARFRDAARRMTVSQLVELIVETCGIERLYAAAADGARSLRHLEHLRSIAFTYDQKIGGSVRQFVDEITRRRIEPDEAEPSLVDEAGDAVRILSVHAAKGLEFETVILPDLEFSVGSQELFLVEEPRHLVMTGQVATLNAHYTRVDGRPLEDIGSEREEAENRRLFYVAVTRAEREVVFVTTPKPQKRGFAQYLKELFQPELGQWPDEGQLVNVLTIGGREVPVIFERGETAIDHDRGRWRLLDRRRERELKNGEIVAHEVPQPPAAESENAAGERATSKRRAAGILLHRVLERWDGRVPIEPLLAAIAAEAAHDEVELVRERLATVQRSAHFARIVAAENAARELPVAWIGENGDVVERRIDRLLHEDDADVVVDYKSGAPNAVRLERDREQVRAYCEAVARMHGRPCRGMLWYIDVDHDRLIEC